MKLIFSTILLFSIVSICYSQKKINSTGMTVRSSLKLSDKANKNINVKKLPYFLKKEKNKIVASKGYVLYGKGNIFIVWDAAAFNKLEKDEEGNISTYFAIITKGRLGGNDGNYFLYCSCGSAIAESSGDNCSWNMENGKMKCSGSCREANEGAECSFTGLQVFDDGRIVVIQY
jgi:hypothetical protein